MTEVKIRWARASDAKTLAAIGHAAWKRGNADNLPDEAQKRITPEVFESFAANQPNNILLAENDDHVLGFAAVANGENTVTDLWVNKADEGQGIGRRLLEEMENELIKRGHEDVRLEILTSNTRTLGLTKYRGYHVTSRGLRMDANLSIPLHKTEVSKRLISA